MISAELRSAPPEFSMQIALGKIALFDRKFDILRIAVSQTTLRILKTVGAPVKRRWARRTRGIVSKVSR